MTAPVTFAPYGIGGGLLATAGTGRRDIVRLECFLADRRWFAPWNTRFARHFGDRPPARTTLVCGLPVAGLLIEVQALVATTPDTGGIPS